MSQGWTIAEPVTGEYQEKGSKFLAFAYPVHSVEAIDQHIIELRKKHPKARHVCYGYVIGLKQVYEKANDDGEPANTAGAPILNHIHGYELSNVLVAVLRYFGGTLLGKGGLIRAYGTAAKLALEQATIIEDVLKKQVWVQVPYEHLEGVMQLVKKFGLPVNERVWETFCNLKVTIDEPQYEEVIKLLENIDQVKVEPL